VNLKELNDSIAGFHLSCHRFASKNTYFLDSENDGKTRRRGAYILPEELSRKCRRFALGVQVNVVSNACFSRSFPDKFHFKGLRYRIHTAVTAYD